MLRCTVVYCMAAALCSACAVISTQQLLVMNGPTEDGRPLDFDLELDVGTRVDSAGLVTPLGTEIVHWRV
eukprot:COSAG02_NODE_61_length_43452_cov_741.297804_10_plen_70_part_00